MTKDQIIRKLEDAGMNRDLVRGEASNGDESGFHIHSDDLASCDMKKITALVAECGAELTDKGVFFYCV